VEAPDLWREDYRCRVDREAIARNLRRKQAEEVLEFEREREQSLEEQITMVIGEVEGPRIDAAAFQSMSEEDAKIVNEEFNPLPYDPGDGSDFFERDDLIDLDEPDPADLHAEELARLNDEIAKSRRRQEAFKAYLTALGP